MEPASTFWFSIAAIFFTLIGLIYNYFNNKATNEKSEQAIRLYQGFLEVTINKNISDALKENHRASKDILFFKNKYPNGDSPI